MLANAAVPRERLESLEDRHVDALIGEAVAAGCIAFVARTARSWLDLNRDEREIDPAMLTPPPPAQRLIQSAKLRGGLGLIPRRIAGAGELWRGPVAASDVEARIASHHRPYHAAIADALAVTRARFGAALLLDCHSMPPVGHEPFKPSPRIVVGDRYGHSASARLVERLVAVIEGVGLCVARNAPYAGGYTLDRHGRPQRGLHAVQIEIDRDLYLERDRRTLASGAGKVAMLLAQIAAAAEDELAGDAAAIAAE